MQPHIIMITIIFLLIAYLLIYSFIAMRKADKDLDRALTRLGDIIEFQGEWAEFLLEFENCRGSQLFIKKLAEFEERLNKMT